MSGGNKYTKEGQRGLPGQSQARHVHGEPTPPRLQLGGGRVHFRRWEAALAARTAIAMAAVTLTVGRCLTACSFPDEGVGQAEAESPPRWPWMPAGEVGSTGETDPGEGSSEAGGSSGSSESPSAEPCQSDEDCGGGLSCDTTGNCVPPEEGSSSSTDDGSESSTAGGAPAPYGPCDRACEAPWGCTQSGGWEACVLACSTNDDCPDDGVCSGGECHLPCPCPDGAECAANAGICWWPL